MTPIDRAISHLHSLDASARLDSPLGRLDARAKVLVTLGFLVTVASFGRHQLLQPLPLVILLSAGWALSEIPVRSLGFRLAIASPVAVLIGMWNPLFEPEPMLRLGSMVVSAGWVSFLSILERFLLGMAAVLLLIGSTGVDAVAAALGRLGVPRVLVTQLLLLYRYVFVLAAEVERMLRAHSLRAPNRPRPELRTVRSMLGELLLRSLARAERVHAAMLCRGFAGELRAVTPLRLGLGDALFVLAGLGFLALVRLADLPRAIGNLLR
ncbi:MAG: cobalt ECF transporter T component CbiQ [Polyangiaceae bacterium]|nr:cobalt ECF transporter T component CbiQ [Polyangiaceae bacterium]